jgi:hypothetical protein
MRKLSTILLPLLALCLSGCSSQPGTPTPTDTALPTAKPQHFEAKRTPTALPSPTPSPMPSPTTGPLPAWCPLPEPPVQAETGTLQIAFIGNRSNYPDAGKQSAWVWTEGAEPIPLADGQKTDLVGGTEWIAFSEDGAYVAYTIDPPQNPVELWRTRLEDSDTVRLIDPHWFSLMGKHPTKTVLPMDLHWVPGTHTIAFHTNLAPDEYGFRYTPDNLWWIDLDTGKALPKNVDGEIFYSPDGRLAAVVNQTQLILMNADTSGQRIIPMENWHTIPQGTTYAEPPRIQWADDSRSFFVIAPDVKYSVGSNPPMTLWMVPVDNPIPIRLTSLDSSDGNRTYSPDHQWVAISRRRPDDPNRYDLHLAQADGSQDVLYVPDIADFPSPVWSPDSYRFVFWNDRIPYLGSLCTGSSPLMESAPPNVKPDDTSVMLHVVWIDPSRLILTAGKYQQRVLYLADIAKRDVPPRLLLDYEISTFDWRLGPIPGE